MFGYEKSDFLHLPTPLEFLPAASADLGIRLYVKRDDLTPLAMGGNKLRKLEYFLKDAQNQKATMLLTVGGAQTNHGRLTCAVARKYGMKGAIVTVDSYPGELSANLLLDAMMGCNVYLKKTGTSAAEENTLEHAVAQIIGEMQAAGESVYYIPMGGSNELGILGYYDCALELTRQIQAEKIEGCRLLCAVGSMGTYMGLAAAALNEKLPYRLTGIGIMPYPRGIKDAALDYYDRVKSFFALPYSASPADFDLTSDYDRGAYNNPCKEVRQAIYYMAEKEALILDPCYTGKAFAALLEMVKKGEIRQGETIIFLHTGGSPGINTPFHRIKIEKEREKFIHILD